MNTYSFLFIVGFLVCFGIFLAKTYNLFNAGKFYNMALGFILFLVFPVAWLLMFIALANYPENLIFSVLYRLSSWLLLIVAVFTAIELILMFSAGSQKKIKAYRPDPVLRLNR